MTSQFQLYQDAAGEFRWRLLAHDHQVVAQSTRGYSYKADAARGIQIIRERGLSATPEIYQDEDGLFRFRVTAPNGTVIASGRAYPNQIDCARSMRLAQRLAGVAAIRDQTA